jgi:hypothetical protein
MVDTERRITMIELENDNLVFSFPEVHPEATLSINFQRTLRIPDNDEIYSLPPGLGAFPLLHVDDHPETVPASWMKHGGVMLPMYQSEAMWISFHSALISDHGVNYPFAVMIAAGKINAVDGLQWEDGLKKDRQNYLSIPEQPWLDGYCVEEGVIRQFTAMPLGQGYTAEEQLTGEAQHGGLQIQVFPMKKEAFLKRFPMGAFEASSPFDDMLQFEVDDIELDSAEMGLAPGGKMTQDIYTDKFSLDEYDMEQTSRCFVHIANSAAWAAITGFAPPTVPPTAKEYTNAGLPWFDYYSDTKALDGAEPLSGLKSVSQMDNKTDDEGEGLNVTNIVKLGKKEKSTVREGDF